ncbi:PCYCGC motif-containing (lipo)protein [Paenibacillus sp.]|uniref:PCYCGC motif-containing (lipo)protein n=1 Tax=Paenibacillus sp. TaxID=58172 RepID=UPI002D6357DB|nr:PCYCGC motif-containing (lipo)protein [Paenibacillus sp.]HZG57159.1 PCYCGC motif-containing (lipo)protein [Paenibacillus sp.]
MIRRSRSRPLRRGLALAALGLLLFVVLSGCASTAGDEHAGHSDAGHAGHGLPDNIEVTASPDILPSFLDDYTETTRNFYSQVYAHKDLLKELNCYCGCMEYNDPHDSLFRCFIAGVDEDGVHWTDHGGSCGICLMELRDAVRMAGEGKTVDEIRAHIDSTYGGAAAATST